MSALDTQVGGGHYKDMKIQPVEFAMANKLDLCQSSIIKYVCRHESKNGRQDLEKAKHFIDLLIGFKYGDEKGLAYNIDQNLARNLANEEAAEVVSEIKAEMDGRVKDRVKSCPISEWNHGYWVGQWKLMINEDHKDTWTKFFGILDSIGGKDLINEYLGELTYDDEWYGLDSALEDGFLEDILVSSFTWRESCNGYEYWSKINNRIIRR